MDTKVTATPFPTDFRSSGRSEVARLEYEGGALTIHLRAEGGACEMRVRFERVEAMRVMDEGNLLEYWPTCSGQTQRLFEIHDGGWLTQEKGRSGSGIGYFPRIREFLVTSDWECVSVLSFESPSVESRRPK